MITARQKRETTIAMETLKLHCNFTPSRLQKQQHLCTDCLLQSRQQTKIGIDTAMKAAECTLTKSLILQ